MVGLAGGGVDGGCVGELVVPTGVSVVVGTDDGGGAAVVAGAGSVVVHVDAAIASAETMMSSRNFTKSRLPLAGEGSCHLSSYRPISRRAKTML